MAEEKQIKAEVLHKLGKQLTCSICFNLYTNPRTLPCFHSFCLHCLKHILPEVTQNGDYALPCPTCRCTCQIPPQGVQALPSSFVINNLTEVYELMKKVSGNRETTCDNCREANADRYCKQCAKFLCTKCLQQHNNWITDHQSVTVDEVVNAAYEIPRAKPDQVKMKNDIVKIIDGFKQHALSAIAIDEYRLSKPCGIAITNDGQIVVAEWNGDCITILSRDGTKVKSFGSHGEGRGQLTYPNGIAITSNDTILVADWSNHRIQLFTMDGECISCVGSEGNGSLQFVYPTDIAINKTTGHVYVVDCLNHKVQVLNADLTFSHMFGSKGSHEGQLNYPYGIAIDNNGFVYVADTGNHHIQKFTAEGQFILSFGTEGSRPGQLSRPHDITVDNDILYICETWSNCRVSVFTVNGEFIHCFGKTSDYSRSAIDNNGYLYVNVDDKIHIY